MHYKAHDDISDLHPMRKPSKTKPFLPPELYRSIVDWITDQPTLYALLLVNSDLNYEAERVLYRKISPKGRTVQEKLFYQLYHHKRVAKLVLDLHVFVEDHSYWSRLSLALRALVNLKSLSILFSWQFSYYRVNSPMTHILDQCPFQLESFTWPFPFDQKLVRFLENQPRIRRLNFRWGFQPRGGGRFMQGQFPRNKLSPKALPQLSILTGSISVINSLLPGRKITHLFWLPSFLNEAPDLARIGRALKNIRVLKYSVDAPPLDAIINYLGKLEVLQWTRENYQELLLNVSLLTQLQKIIFLVPLPSDPQKFIERLFTNNPILGLVDVRLKQNNGFRWSRGSDVPQPIIMSPDNGQWILSPTSCLGPV